MEATRQEMARRLLRIIVLIVGQVNLTHSPVCMSLRHTSKPYPTRSPSSTVRGVASTAEFRECWQGFSAILSSPMFALDWIKL